MKTRTKAIILVTLLALSSTAVLAVEGGNPKKGKYLFKKNCKTCHVAGAEGGEVTPLTKTQRQWDRFFEKKGAACLKHVDGQLNEQEMTDIQQFLFDHASDSSQPETCG